MRVLWHALALLLLIAAMTFMVTKIDRTPVGRCVTLPPFEPFPRLRWLSSMLWAGILVCLVLGC